MKKIVTVLLSLFLAFGIGGLFVSCGDNSAEDVKPEHIHELILRQEQEPTCFQNGRKAHYACVGCDKLFEDAVGGLEVSEVELIVSAEHTYTEQGVCSVCGEHTCSYGEWQEEIKATCIQSGMKGYYQCQICFQYFDGNYQTITDLALPVDKNAHSVDCWEPEMPTSCRYTGVKGHYECQACLKYVDEKLNVIDDLTLPVDESLHNYQYSEGEAATCETDGIMNYYYCDVCYSLFDENKNLYTGDIVLYATEHDWENGRCGTCSVPYYMQGLSYVYIYNVEDEIGGWSVSLGDCTETDIVIPSLYQDKPVISVGEFSYSAITSVSLPERV